MGGRAAPQVGDALPVGRVVAGVVAGQAEVGDFVVHVSRQPERPGQSGEESQAEVLVRFTDPMGLQQPVEGGAFLVGEVVGGDVFGPEPDGFLQVVLPGLLRFARQAVDEVDAEVPEARPAASLHGLDGLAGGMPASQQVQEGVVEGLHAHADAVEGEAAQGVHAGVGEVVRIGFEGDFHGVLQAVRLLQGAEDVGEVFLVQKGMCR